MSFVRLVGALLCAVIVLVTLDIDVDVKVKPSIAAQRIVLYDAVVRAPPMASARPGPNVSAAVAAAFGPGGLPGPARLVLGRLVLVKRARHPQHAPLAAGLAGIASRFLAPYLNHTAAAPAAPLAQADADAMRSAFDELLQTLSAEPPLRACPAPPAAQTTTDPCDATLSHVEALFDETRRRKPQCPQGVATKRCGGRSTLYEAAARRESRGTSRHTSFSAAERRMAHMSFHVMQRSRWMPDDAANTTTPGRRQMCAVCSVVKRMTQGLDINATLNVSCWSRPRDDGPGLCGDGPAGSVAFWNPSVWRLSMDVLYAAKENRAVPPPPRGGSGVVIDAVVAGMFPSSHERCRQIAELRERNILGPMGARRRHYLMSAAVRRPKTKLAATAPLHQLAGAALRKRMAALQRRVPGSIDTWLVVAGPFSPAFGHARAAPAAVFRTIYFLAMQGNGTAFALPPGTPPPDFTLWIRPDVVFTTLVSVVPRGEVAYLTTTFENRTTELPLAAHSVYGSSINGVTKGLMGDTTLLISMSKHSVMAQRLYGGLHASCFRVMFRLTEQLAGWILHQTRVAAYVFMFRDNIDGTHAIDSMDDVCGGSE
jgi:hypothetical protein